jgi:hypothetical protein
MILRSVKVDGYCSETNEVFEFQGCYYHGCPKCYKIDRNDPLYDDPSQTLHLRHESTVAKIEKLKNLNFIVHEMWECQFRQLLKETPEIDTFTKSHPLLSFTPLNPRDAFYGGRTENTQLYHDIKDGEKIKYVDVCSLYP